MTHHRWLSLILALLCTVASLLGAALLFAIHVVRAPDYPHKVFDPSLIAQEAAFTMRNQRCDVLVFGDSTASIGVDPRILTAETGLSACNIASTRPIVDDLGTLPVDAFLAHNPAPRIIVLQFGPELFFRGNNWEHNGPYAPMVMLARDVPTLMALTLMLRHPAETTQFVFFIVRRALIPPTFDPRQQQLYDHDVASLEASHGMLPLDYPPTRACLPTPVELHGPLDTRWIQQLRARYQTASTQVLLKASPIPVCDVQLQTFQQQLAPYMDENVEPLPIPSFLHDDRHPSIAGAEQESHQLADALRSRLKITRP